MMNLNFWPMIIIDILFILQMTMTLHSRLKSMCDHFARRKIAKDIAGKVNHPEFVQIMADAFYNKRVSSSFDIIRLLVALNIWRHEMK